ncbi:MAG: hypothetical protein JHD16_00835 [Solirubrobacteraceae bacterium]|nr:hypothetical protein [Solirubrobacteraceae bacterium]
MKWGTCLDLAVTYAGMCMSAHIDPLLIVGEPVSLFGGEGHALVALIPGRQRGERDPLILPGCKPEYPGVQVVTDADRFARLVDNVLLPVECTGAVIRAASGPASAATTSFADATAEGAAALERRDVRWRVIDVAWLHEPDRDGVILAPPLDPPEGLLGIGSYLPGGLGHEKLGSAQQEILDELTGATGIHVIAAHPGFGKSTIARRLVANAPFGSGWFLGASDKKTLTNSLAEAELIGQNQTSVGLADADRDGYAEAARGRLREADHPWTVILDNADDKPDEALARIPPTDARLGQLVVLTTTDLAWANASGHRVHPLGPAADSEVDAELGNSDIAPLVAGRWLLVSAFKHLADALGVKPSQLSVDASIARTGENGPLAIWQTARDQVLTEGQVRAARCAAYLPPDVVSVAAVQECAPGEGTAERLVATGLLDVAAGEHFGRMHRLIGKAIRDDPDGSDLATRDHVAATLTGSAEAGDNLAEFGDRALILEILALLEHRCRSAQTPDRGLGISLHALGSVLELRGATREAADTFDTARAHLTGTTDRPLLADCLLGMARRHFRDSSPTQEQIDEAFAWADEGEKLMQLAGLGASAGRFLAMKGLLRRKRGTLRGRPKDQQVRDLRAGLDMVETADRMRAADPTTRPEERARSRFNLAGPRINLAQRDPDNSAEHLSKAEEIYREVLRQREAFYPGLDHPHVAACVSGLAMVSYYRAVLLPSDAHERQRLLREATQYERDAAAQRERLAGSRDDGDVGKSLRLTAKIAIARWLFTVASDKRAERHEALLSEAERELLTAGLLPSGDEAKLPAEAA